MTTDSARIRLLMVDDHKVVRLGLLTLLSHYPDIEVVGEAGSVAEAVDRAAACRPGLVLMDVRLPDGKGFEACRQIRILLPDVRVLFLTSFADEQIVIESIDAGADGYLLKEIDEATLVKAIRDVARGQSIFDPAITRHVLERARTPGVQFTQDPWDNLSPQERRVLALVAQGKTNKQIAMVLALSDKTVKNYLSNVLEKLGMTRRSQAAAFFVQHSFEGGRLALTA